MCQLGCMKEKKTIETILHFLMASVPSTQRQNEVEVLREVCDVVHDASVLKTPQKDIGRRGFTVPS